MAKNLSRSVVVGLLALSSGFVAPRADAEEISPTGKGIAGGALLGAEVVVITESIVGVRSGLLYAVGAGVGAAGGGVGGYFLEQNSSDGRLPIYLLAGGLALVIPAVILTLNATRYRPDDLATEDRAPTNAPTADPGAVGGSMVIDSGGAKTSPAKPAPAPAPAPAGGGGAPQSFLRIQPNMLRIGVPTPTVKPVWSVAEQKQYGLSAGTEVRVPILHYAF